MAVRSKSGRRLRWLVLLGLVGAGAWAYRARQAGPAGLLETWPTPQPAPSSAAGAARVVPSGSVSDPSDEPVADAVTPPLGIERRVVAEPLASTPPAVEAPAAADVAADTDSLLVPDTATTEAPADPGPFPAGQSSPSGQALFSPPVVNGTSPAEPPAARPSPSPRPRPASADNRYGPGSAAPLPDGSSPGPEYTIKGNAGSKLFHRPDSPYYARTKAEVWFRTATDARAAGFTEWVPRSRASS
jgi:hypothetical protein